MKHSSTLKPLDSLVVVNGVQTSNGCLVAREFEESSKMGRRKTAQAGAPIDDARKWSSIVWNNARVHVRRLQMRIAKAVQERRWNKVKSLQNLLTHSFYAKLLAVKRVTSNKGKKTPGVDGILWKGARAKWRALARLNRHGYSPQPLRRIYIPKKNGKKRPLSIPTMLDRAMQALYKLALAPVAETTADGNSYGFREGRSCADAIQAGFNALNKPNSAPWVLEGDIKGCFDNISHEWLLENIPMDKVILQKWLKAGYMEDGIHYSSHKGTPQGGIISPLLSNMTLDGLEEVIRKSVPRRKRVNFIRYADDFIITGKHKSLLVYCVKPEVVAFLNERGLSLSEEKTVLTHIRDGFTFLGQTFRRHGGKLHITPAKQGVLALIQKVGTLIRENVCTPIPALIKSLNQILRGWANYHRHVVSAKVFSRVDSYVFEELWRMLKKRHRRRSVSWLSKKYWTAAGRRTLFAFAIKDPKGLRKVYQVIKLTSLGIQRHIKIKAAANPYLPEYSEYFWVRRNKKDSKVLPALSARGYRAMKATVR